MSKLVVNPVPATRIELIGASADQDDTIREAHLNALLSAYVAQYNVTEDQWGELEGEFFGDYSDERRDTILGYLDEVIVWFENTLVVYDLTQAYETQEYENVYAMVSDEIGENGAQCPEQLTVFICDQLWNNGEFQPEDRVGLLTTSIFHVMATYCGLQTRRGVASQDEAHSLAGFDADQAADCAASYLYYVSGLTEQVQTLVLTYRNTFSTLYCQIPSENSDGQSNDEVYLELNKERVWPNSGYQQAAAHSYLDVDIAFTTNDEEPDKWTLMDDDDLSYDDEIYKFNLKTDSTVYYEHDDQIQEMSMKKVQEGVTYAFWGQQVDINATYKMYFTVDAINLEVGDASSENSDELVDYIVHDEL